MSASVELLQGADTYNVECPGCGRERRVEPGLFVCSECGAWFRVRPE